MRLRNTQAHSLEVEKGRMVAPGEVVDLNSREPLTARHLASGALVRARPGRGGPRAQEPPEPTEAPGDDQDHEVGYALEEAAEAAPGDESTEEVGR